MEKVKVSKEVAEFMESFKTLGDVNWENALLEQHTEVIRDTDATIKEGAKCMLQYSTFEVAQMLVNGWEVEKSPEDKILETFQRQYTQCDADDICDKRSRVAYANGIVYTLDTLGIKIEGINK